MKIEKQVVAGQKLAVLHMNQDETDQIEGLLDGYGGDLSHLGILMEYDSAVAIIFERDLDEVLSAIKLDNERFK